MLHEIRNSKDEWEGSINMIEHRLYLKAWRKVNKALPFTYTERTL